MRILPILMITIVSALALSACSQPYAGGVAGTYALDAVITNTNQDPYVVGLEDTDSITVSEARFGVTCTASGAAHLAALAPEPSRVALAYHGLDLARLPAPPARRAAGGPFVLLSVGRLVAKKGYDDLLAALARLPADLDWRFRHVGGGDLSKALKAEAERRGLAGRIDWLGKRARDEVFAEMRAADLFVLPSKIAPGGDRDGLPNVLMEAASQRLPILSTAVSAIPEFARDGVEARLVAPGDPAALAEAIAALAADAEGRARLAEAAHARLHAAFGMEPGIDVVAARLAAALGEAAPAAPFRLAGE